MLHYESIKPLTSTVSVVDASRGVEDGSSASGTGVASVSVTTCSASFAVTALRVSGNTGIAAAAKVYHRELERSTERYRPALTGIVVGKGRVVVAVVHDATAVRGSGVTGARVTTSGASIVRTFVLANDREEAERAGGDMGNLSSVDGYVVSSTCNGAGRGDAWEVRGGSGGSSCDERGADRRSEDAEGDDGATHVGL